MRLAHTALRALTAVVTAAVLTAGPAAATPAQDEPVVESGDIVPKPNSGTPPEEAGDRGGALQLMLPALMVAAVGGGAWHISRQARANREARGSAGQPPSSPQAGKPSMNPER